jgi:hypothetical protein
MQSESELALQYTHETTAKGLTPTKVMGRLDS